VRSDMEVWRSFKEDIKILKDFDENFDAEMWEFHWLESFSKERDLDNGDFENYGFNILFYKNTFIIQIDYSINDNYKNVKIYYHTENSLNDLFFDEPDVYADFFNYLDNLKEKPEIINKIEKIKLSQKLNNF